MFVIGAFGDGADVRYNQQREFIKKLLLKYDLGNTVFGIVSHGQDGKVILNFEFGGKADLVQRMIKDFKNPTDGIYITNALSASKQLLDQSTRTKATKSIVFFIDSNSRTYYTKELEQAAALKSAGYKLIIVGVGGDIDRQKLLPLVHTEKGLILLPDLGDVTGLLSIIKKAIKPGNKIIEIQINIMIFICYYSLRSHDPNSELIPL